MDNNLVNGWYKCVEGSDCWTEGEFYYFENGCTKDDKGNRRPCNGACPQAYNDPASEKWFKWAGLVPADEKEVYKMKNDAINDFYKATKTSNRWTSGKQYYIRDGRVEDDTGVRRPFGDPLRYQNTEDKCWLSAEGLVPATDEMDVLDRVNEAAVNCINIRDCANADCPYLRVPSCKDQMIDDFAALRKMRGNRKEQECEAGKPVMVGCLCRDKQTLELFKIIDASVGVQLHVKLCGVGTGHIVAKAFLGMDDFYDHFEPWEYDQLGGSFDFVATEDIPPLTGGYVYNVDGGKILGIPKNDLRFKSYEELEAHFGGKTIQTDWANWANHRNDDPTEGLYTGFAVAVKDFRAVSKVMTKGKIYRFVNGVAKLDNDLTILFTDHVFNLYFKPVTNLESN